MQPPSLAPSGGGSKLSIPFSSGQRMQRAGGRPGRGTSRPFQSPFHRVKGCNSKRVGRHANGYLHFQSPFHRVKGCNLRPPRPGRGYFPPLSIPFSSGQRMQPSAQVPNLRGPRGLSIPFSSGQRMQPRGAPALPGWNECFQSPFHRVKGCNYEPLASVKRVDLLSIPFSSGQRMQLDELVRILAKKLKPFNPLFIGSKDATYDPHRDFRPMKNPFNPLFIGSKDATAAGFRM